MYGSAEFRWMDAPSQPGFLFLLCSPMPSLSLSLYICVCGWVGALPGYKSLCHECATLQKSSSVDIRRRQKGKGRLCLLSPGYPGFSVLAVDMARNLLKNPSGEEELEFWELTENGGSEWKVEDMPGDCGHDFCDEGVTKYFATSFELCLKRQVIDLLAEGYTSEQLDAQPPVKVEDWYCGRTDCGCTYQMTVCLLNENHEVIQEFKPDPVTLDPETTEDCSWKQISHTFSEYGAGMRFISFEHGGQDTKFWDGWFGVRVTGSSVTVDI